MYIITKADRINKNGTIAKQKKFIITSKHASQRILNNKTKY